MADAIFVSPDPGAVMSEIRYRVAEAAYGFFSEGGSFEYAFGTNHGKQSVTLFWDLGDFGTYSFVFTCAQLDAGDVMPFKSMIQCPGFDDWMTIQRSTVGVPNWTFGQVLAYWKSAVTDLKQDMINTWSSASPRSIIYDEAEIISGELKSELAIIPASDNDGMYCSREALYIGSDHEPGVDSFYWKSTSSGMPGGVGGANFDSSGIVKAISDLSMQGWDISFNHGGTIFSARSNIIVG